MLDIAIQLAIQSEGIELQMHSSECRRERKNWKYKLQYMYQNKKVKKFRTHKLTHKVNVLQVWLDWILWKGYTISSLWKKNVISAVRQITSRACAEKTDEHVNSSNNLTWRLDIAYAFAISNVKSGKVTLNLGSMLLTALTSINVINKNTWAKL